MALKKKVTKEEFEKLSKDVKAVYTANGDHYLLDLEGDEVAELRRAKDREAADAAKLRADLKVMSDKLTALEAKAAEAPGDKDKDKDINKLQTEWNKKFAELEAAGKAKEKELTDKQAARDAATKKSIIAAAATAIATKISTVPDLMADKIALRFDVDFTGDEPKLIILDTNGKASAMTQEQLQKEFVQNKAYASIIVGSKASGSGAPRDGNQPKKPSGAGSSGQADKEPDLSKMAPKDLVARIKERKEQDQQ